MIAVTDLETMDRAALVAAWSSLTGTPVPKGLSKPLLRRLLAVEIQQRQHGALPGRVKAALVRQATSGSRPSTPSITPGGRLVREWNGVTHVVEVTPDGYVWNGARHRSLSAIARAITGAHWSGPRFFGLTGKGRR